VLKLKVRIPVPEKIDDEVDRWAAHGLVRCVLTEDPSKNILKNKHESKINQTIESNNIAWARAYWFLDRNHQVAILNFKAIRLYTPHAP
jgi:hypothetical protein